MLTRIPDKSHSKNDSGATLVEFAIVGALFFGLIGIIFDLGIGIRTYNLLTHTTGKAARYAALSMEDNCGELKQKAADNAAALANQLGFAAEFEATSTGDTIIITGSIDMNCIICLLLPKTITISSTSARVLESPIPECV